MNRSVSVGVVVFIVVVSIAALGVPMAFADTGGDGPAVDHPQQTAAETETDTYAYTQTQPFTGTHQQVTRESAAFDSIGISSQEFDTTTFEITVHENGSATWTFRHDRRFGTDNDSESDDREAFEEFAEEFESEETELYDRFTSQAEAMTESGAELTDREMAATNFNRSATIEEQFGTRGIVEMSFLWEEFAVVEDDTVDAGDVFQDIYLGPDQSIVFEAGDGLTFDRVEPEAEAQHSRESLENADSVRWSGEQQFLAGNPRAVFVQSEASNGGETTGSVSTIVNGGETPWYLAAGVILALGLAVGALWYRRQRTGTDGDDGENERRNAAHAADSDEPASEANPPSDADSVAGEDAESDPLPTDELLTDEDRVVKLIRENGGRMKQVNIVQETGWSKSKVSMLLSDMEEAGTISKLRVGRENIISLEGFEPEATKSPFDE
ncbi:hypothetical protein GS429_10520 [Natronorubrum sp. JWXQ-INN-674]|uniref:HTH iclR-type domain-containing protein n=1 Tax=Natronorubrum halalkaliphilum TaxID=2691917 RepID=A0A6B0VPM6_9EURY|nr:hypothetical protein [Natronorubrum halalkaliphilum]MXV62489.1 hypothetical protein [Natronorubrum halalkaliphilum]